MKNILKKFYLPLIAFSVIVFLFFPVFDLQATGWFGGTGTGDSIDSPLKNKADNFPELINSIIDWVSNIGILVAVFFIVYSGMQFMTSGGNEDRITKARKTLIWSLVGLAILIIGKGFITLITNILNPS